MFNAGEPCSRIANGRVLPVGLYTHRIQKLSFLQLFTNLFYKNFPPLFGISAALVRSCHV